MKKKFYKIIIVLFTVLLLFILVKKYRQSKLLDFLKEKRILIAVHILENEGKILIFKGKNKISEIPAENIVSILSVENNSVFYLETNMEKKESSAVQIDLDTKKVTARIKIPFSHEIFYARKINNTIYFSDRSIFKDKRNKVDYLYLFDINRNKLLKIMDYDNEGMPLITKEEIIYSKNGKIYSLDTYKNNNNYLFEGSNPFAIEEEMVYYEENGNILKRGKNSNNKKILFKKDNNQKELIKKISENLYVFMKEKEMEWFMYLEYTELEMKNIKNNENINLNNIFFKNVTRKGNFIYPILIDTSVIFIDDVN